MCLINMKKSTLNGKINAYCMGKNNKILGDCFLILKFLHIKLVYTNLANLKTCDQGCDIVATS